MGYVFKHDKRDYCANYNKNKNKIVLWRDNESSVSVPRIM